MKFAEDLMERAYLQKQLSQLGNRLRVNHLMLPVAGVSVKFVFPAI